VQDSKYTPPFKTLGTHLKYLREHSAETLAEVSGAVEINEDILERIEQGMERPSEEILMLLISHFNMQDTEAVQLWELAGYDRRTNPDIVSMNIQEELQSGKPMVMLLAIDVRTQYTDGVEVSVNNAGLVMTFTQAGGLGQPQPVARVGMSLQQAEAVSGALQQALLRTRYHRPKGLPAPQDLQQTPESQNPETQPPKSDTHTGI
jgi:hypothetical protein